MKLNNKEIDMLRGIIGDYIKTVLKDDLVEEIIYICGIKTNKREVNNLRKKFIN